MDYTGAVESHASHRTGAERDGLEHRDDAKEIAKDVLVLLDERTLDRQCLAQCLTASGIGKTILAYRTAEEWQADPIEQRTAAAALLKSWGQARHRSCGRPPNCGSRCERPPHSRGYHGGFRRICPSCQSVRTWCEGLCSVIDSARGLRGSGQPGSCGGNLYAGR